MVLTHYKIKASKNIFSKKKKKKKKNEKKKKKKKKKKHEKETKGKRGNKLTTKSDLVAAPDNDTNDERWLKYKLPSYDRTYLARGVVQPLR